MKLQNKTVFLLTALFIVQFKSGSANAHLFKAKRFYNTNNLWTFSDHNEKLDKAGDNPKNNYYVMVGNKNQAVNGFKTKFSKESIKDPLEFMTTPQLITTFGYPAESYTIRTEDSYLLTIHRIPYSNKNGSTSTSNRAVLLHHGLLASSADWVLTGPNKSLALILSDLGYDVWLANARGNIYSRAHVHLDPNSNEFWDFTFNEIGRYDLPAIIDFIRNVKGPSSTLHYIGHSMGTTVLFALLSTRPEYNDRITKGIALAPVAYMSRIRSPIRLLAPFSRDIQYLFNLLGLKEFLPQNWVMKWLSEAMCELNLFEEVICENSLFVICGYDPKQFNATLMPIVLGHDPAGASTKTVVHYAQEIKDSGRFQQFDFGSKRNVELYNSTTPLEYDLSKISLPIALISGKNDWLSSDVDVTNLFVKLRNGIEHYIVPNDDFNHIDFLFGIDAPKLVYTKIVQLLAGSK